MKKTLALIVMLAAVLSLICCAEETPSAYESIEMSFFKEDVIALFGEGTSDGEYMVLNGEVACAFYESGRLMAKSLVFENIAEVAQEAEIPLEKIRKLKQGTHFDEVKALMGADGTEIMRINLSDEDNAGVRRVMAWQNAGKVSVQALFELDDGEWLLFTIAETALQ